MSAQEPERQDMTEQHETEYGNLLTKADVAEMLGMKESMITTLVSSGEMPHLRLGKRKFVRFTPDHVQQYLRSKEVPVHRASDE